MLHGDHGDVEQECLAQHICSRQPSDFTVGFTGPSLIAPVLNMFH